MKQILIAIGLYLIKQEWFQFAVVKLVTKVAQMTSAKAAETTTKIDDNLVAFIQRNKDELITIASREVPRTDTPIDKMLLDALKELK